MYLRKKISLWLCWLLLLSSVTDASADETLLPITLKVIDFDTKLNAFLLSGDFSNTLTKPLIAWRGELRLKNTATNEIVSFFYEHQARRHISPGDWGVWSFWLDYKPQIPEHNTLKQLTANKIAAELRLLRVLYLDNTQQAF